ncbi:MAG TPA: KamA family radical SAM protein [Bacteroidales bacterium]|nr:KamA family radical SAM protein [Bacteroidales bacterium]
MKAVELRREAFLTGVEESAQANETDEPPGHIAQQEADVPLLSKTTTVSKQSLEFLRQHFPGSTVQDWNNWQWQIKNSFTNLNDLSRVIQLSENEIKPRHGQNDILPLRITPYYASLLDPVNPGQALRRSVVPVFDEYIVSPCEASDPLSEARYSPIANLVHRYPDRVLFLATGFCASYCRYCTRSHMVASGKCHTDLKAWKPAIEYIKKNRVVRDVLISGGDVLTISDNLIEYLLSEIRAIPHVEIIRIGTKIPVVLPQRITKRLTGILKKFQPLYLSIHFTHPDELTPEVAYACNMLANSGIPLGSQTVLLKGVNDEVTVMKKLMTGLLKIRVRPYYLYQCDPILGSAHFRTSISKGLEIMAGLRGFISGYAVPQYVVDAPGGGGKIPLLPDYFQGRENGKVVLKNYEGTLFYYPDEG